MKKKNCCNIGGQAVLEGVMMRGESSMAIAVRDPDGKIAIESSRFTPNKEKGKIYRTPVFRGIISFFSSFVTGMKITMRSTEVFGDVQETEPSKFEKWLAKTFHADIMNVVAGIGVFLGLVLSLALFVILPQIIALAIFSGAGLLEVSFAEGAWKAFKTSTQGLGFGWHMLYEVIRGVVRILIFVGYIFLVGLMKDIKRLFMYHGAEHKTISCYENGLPLTVENAQKMTTVHDRCGTTFMFIVMFVSILFFTVVPVSMIDVGNGILTFFVQLVVRVALIPLVAGISYEFLKLFARYDNIFTKICKAPGLWLQKLTTKQPDDSMVEVAIAAFNEVLALEADKEMPTKSFVTYSTVEKTVKGFEDALKSKHEAELIVMKVLGVKTKTELYDGRRISSEQEKSCAVYAKRRIKGAPLQYVLGETCFYGYDIRTDSRALIPRFDTEVVAEAAIKEIKKFSEPEVLDLCTGSGAIAIAIKKETPESRVTATDVSLDAVSLCRENVSLNGVEIEVLEGSMFMPVRDREFDVIVSNPPYIQSGAIKDLDAEVRDYEPTVALDGGADGLDFYRDIALSAKKHLKENGVLLLEVGIGQAEEVAKILGSDYDIEFVKDLNTPPIDRAVVAKYKGVRE